MRSHTSTPTRRDFIACLGASLVFPSLAFATEKGIETKLKEWDNGNHAFITKAKNRKYKAEVVSASEITGNPFASTKEVQERTNASVVFNGSFFENDGSPSGLYFRNGTMLHPFIPGKGDGILYIDPKGQISIMEAIAFERYKGNVKDALQVNLLSKDGKTFYARNSADKKQPRNFIGLSNEGLVDVIFKNTNFILGDEYMRSNHYCTTVAALDGGPSASAYDKSGNTSFKSGDIAEAKVQNFIALYEQS